MKDVMSDFFNRMEVLRLADRPSDTPDQVIVRARKYMKFLAKPDDDNNGTTPVTPPAPAKPSP